MLILKNKKGRLRRLAAIALSLFSLFTLTFNHQALRVYGQAIEQKEDGSAYSQRRNVSVYINGAPYSGRAFLRDSVTNVGIREISMYMGAKSVSWDSKSKTATVRGDSLLLTAKNQSLYIVANERYLFAKSGVFIERGTMYVPIRTLAKAFSCTVTWDPKTFSAHLSGGGAIKSGNEYYESESLYWLSRIIHAESQGEPLLGKICVGNVVLNRVISELFPDDVYGVIFDRRYGVSQFTPAATGTVHCNPNEESIIAAKLCLDGAVASDKILFFFNPAIAESTWISDTRPFVMTVGNHKFYA